MYRLHLVLFSSLLSLFLSSTPLPAQDSVQTPERHDGAAPRASAAKYRSHVEKDGFGVGAELLTKKEASDTFATDLNRCCLVVLVSVYPKKGEPVELSLADFTLQEVGSDKLIRPESPTTIAAMLERKKNPGGGVDVATTTGVGYESGTYTDPTTGRPVHVRGVSTNAGVAVTAGGNSVPPDVAGHDRDVMEWELAEKGLPLDKATIPIAGYLYFPVPKPSKGAKYQLTYRGNSEPLILSLP
jgi:hypothetical protein